MSRMAREISESGLYHIIFRGINKQNIFENDRDYKKILDVLFNLKNEMSYEIYAYCLMSNHVHLLIKEKNRGEISLIMKRLLTKYARWYNVKYDRSGALIANRYKSKPIETDEYFLSVIRYIHQNPVKAGIVEKIEDYKWSSYNEYFSEKEGLTDKKFVTEMMERDEFKNFHKEDDDMLFEVDDKVKFSDDEIRRRILKKYEIEPKNIDLLDKKERNCLLQKLKKEYSIREIERVTGISRGVVYKS